MILTQRVENRIELVDGMQFRGGDARPRPQSHLNDLSQFV